MNIIHIVFGDNENTEWLVGRLLEQDDGIITVIDNKYVGLMRKGEVTYADVNYLEEIVNLPIKFYYYAYMDPKNRKRKK